MCALLGDIALLGLLLLIFDYVRTYARRCVRRSVVFEVDAFDFLLQ